MSIKRDSKELTTINNDECAHNDSMEQVSTMKPWPALRCVPGSLLLSVTENLSEQEFHLMLKPKDTGRTLFTQTSVRMYSINTI